MAAPRRIASKGPMAAPPPPPVEYNVPAHWNDFLPSSAKEKQDALAVLLEARRNPELTLQCFEHGWDGLRRLRQAREVVTKALPLMDEMRRAETEAAREGGGDGDDAERIPFRPSVRRLRKARAESSRLRSMERKARKEVNRITKERETIEQALKECQRLRDGFDEQLAQHQAVVSKCSGDAEKLEHDQQAVKQALTHQSVALFSKLAGIELMNDGRLDGDHPGATEPAPIDGAGCRTTRSLEPQRTVTRTALKAGLFQHGTFTDPGVREHVFRRVRESGGEDGAAEGGLPPAQIPDPALDEDLDATKERRSGEMLRTLRSSGKEPRTGHQPQDERVQTWEGLRDVVRRYHEGAPIPQLLLEPDGKEGELIDSCWWDRFVAFWTTEAAEPVNRRMHFLARQYLSEWRELCLDLVDAGDGAANREALDALLPVVTRAGPPVPEPASSDSEPERVRQVEDCAKRVYERLRRTLADGAVVGDAAAFIQDFLDAPPERRDLEGLCDTLQAVQQQPLPAQATPPPPPPAAAPAAAQPKTKTKRRRQPQGHAKGWMHGWDAELEKAVERGEVSKGDREALSTIAGRFVNLVFSKGGSRSTMMRQYEWVSERIGYMVNFLVNIHNTTYLRSQRRRDHNLGTPGHESVEDRIRRYEKLKELVDRMRKFMKSARMKPIEGSKSVVELPSNYIHRDMWVVDFPLCTLQQALTPGGAERANVAEAFNYTMGGWACLRCVKRLETKDGNCGCRCFRGHTRTECVASNQCYGFHPTRFMELISRGLPRDPTRYAFCRQGPELSSTTTATTTTPAFVQRREKNWEAVMREDLFPVDDDDDEEEEEEEDEDDEEEEEEDEEKGNEGSVEGAPPEPSDSGSESGGGSVPRKKKAPKMSFHKRTWTSRQRWRFWRQCIKDMAEEGDPWYGVIPEAERDPAFSGIVDDFSPLLEDWFNRARTPRKRRKRDRRKARPPVPRTRWLARFHLEMMLDETKWDPARREQHPPNWGGPSWRWISGSCPLCSMPMESNQNEHCRGLCSGCRAWQSILVPEKQMIALKGSPFEKFARGSSSSSSSSSAAAAKKKKQQQKKKAGRAAKRGTKRSRRPTKPPKPAVKRARRARQGGSVMAMTLLKEWSVPVAAPKPPTEEEPVRPQPPQRARQRGRGGTGSYVLSTLLKSSAAKRARRLPRLPPVVAPAARSRPKRTRRPAMRQGAFLEFLMQRGKGA